MAGMNLFDPARGPTEFEYDRDADTLYVSFGPPTPATGIDMGHGVIVRYDEAAGKVVGVTVVGIGDRVGAEINRQTGTGRTPR